MSVKRSLGRCILGMVLIVTILCSCSQKPSAFSKQTTPHHYLELAQAVAMMDSVPEQALLYLESSPVETALADWSALEQQEYRVLLVEAQYKSGQLGETSIPLDATVAFLDSLAPSFPEDAALRFLRAKASYYLGAENTFAQNDVVAATHYVAALKTVWAAPASAIDPQQTRFKGLCHFRLGEVFPHPGD